MSPRSRQYHSYVIAEPTSVASGMLKMILTVTIPLVISYRIAMPLPLSLTDYKIIITKLRKIELTLSGVKPIVIIREWCVLLWPVAGDLCSKLKEQ